MSVVTSAQIPVTGQEYGEYLQIAEGYARRHGVDAHTASDIAQEVGLAIFQRGGVPVPTDGGRYCPAGYVLRTTQNKMINESQKAHKRPLLQAEEDLEVTAAPIKSTEDEWMKGIVSAGLRDAMQNLTPAHREVLLLSATGYNDREIAAQLGVAEATVRTRLHRARHNIKSLLDNRGDL